MSVESVEFERLIERIQRLVEQPGSEVTWNDRIPDPDNPVQLRQIDISIRRDDSLTLVECRLHSAPQDVKWVEELIGRKQSLQADAIMAVSSSGFTKGALAKAKAFDITLRDMHTLTEEEISLWGHRTRAWLEFVEFSQMKVNIAFGGGTQERNLLTENINNYIQTSNILERIVIQIASQFDTYVSRKSVEWHQLKATINLGEPITSDAYILKSEFTAAIRWLKVEVNMFSVLVFGEPSTTKESRNVSVEHLEHGASRVVKSPSKISLSIDLTNVPVPPNSVFKSFLWELDKARATDTLEVAHVYNPPVTLSGVDGELRQYPTK